MGFPRADPNAAKDTPPPRALKRLRKAGTLMQVCCAAMQEIAVW